MLIGYRFYDSVPVITEVTQRDDSGKKVKRKYINLSLKSKDVTLLATGRVWALRAKVEGRMVREIHSEYGITTVKEFANA